MLGFCFSRSGNEVIDVGLKVGYQREDEGVENGE